MIRRLLDRWQGIRRGARPRHTPLIVHLHGAGLDDETAAALCKVVQRELRRRKCGGGITEARGITGARL